MIKGKDSFDEFWRKNNGKYLTCHPLDKFIDKGAITGEKLR